MAYNLNIQGNLPKTYFPTSWLSDKSVGCELVCPGMYSGCLDSCFVHGLIWGCGACTLASDACISGQLWRGHQRQSDFFFMGSGTPLINWRPNWHRICRRKCVKWLDMKWNFRISDLGEIPKRRAPKNDAGWRIRFVQNSHGEPIGDTND